MPDTVLQDSLPLLLLLLAAGAEVMVPSVRMPHDHRELAGTLQKRRISRFGFHICKEEVFQNAEASPSRWKQICRDGRDLSLTWQAVTHQVQVLLHRGQHFGASAVDASFGGQMLVKGLEDPGGHVRRSEQPSSTIQAQLTPYSFVFIAADVVRVRDKQEAVPPLLVLLDVLKDGSREDGLVLQGNLQKMTQNEDRSHACQPLFAFKGYPSSHETRCNCMFGTELKDDVESEMLLCFGTSI